MIVFNSQSLTLKEVIGAYAAFGEGLKQAHPVISWSHRPAAYFTQLTILLHEIIDLQRMSLMSALQVWAYPTTDMQCEWLGERVATVDINRAINNVILDREDAGWGPNAVFRFPLEGGTGAIWKKVSKLLPDRNQVDFLGPSLKTNMALAHTGNVKILNRVYKLYSCMPCACASSQRGRHKRLA